MDNDNMNIEIEKLIEAVNILTGLNSILYDVSKECYFLYEGKFNANTSSGLFYFEDAEKQNSEVPKMLNFPVLYSSENEDVQKALKVYKDYFDANCIIIADIREKYAIASYNYLNYFQKVFDSMVELNNIVEVQQSLRDYVCETAAESYLNKKINPSLIDSDYLIATLPDFNDEQIIGYIELVKNKLREIQGDTPFLESNLEVYRDEVEEPEDNGPKASDYQNEFKKILKNVNKYDK